MIKAPNTGKDTPVAACRKACSKIGLGLMPLSNASFNIEDIFRLPEYVHRINEILVTDGQEKYYNGISTFLSTPKGGAVHFF